MPNDHFPQPPPGAEYKVVQVRKSWLKRLLSEGDGEPSVRRVVFFLSFLFGAVFCVAYREAEISDSVKEIVITIITGSFSVMGLGRVAEALESKWEK
jgi:hypothetical protein